MRLLPALLSLPLVAGAPLAADLAAEALPVFGDALDSAFTADAAFIRRGKLKKKAVAGYKVVVVVGDDTPNDPSDDAATIDVAFPSLSGGTIPDTTVDTPRRAKTRWISPPSTCTLEGQTATCVVLVEHFRVAAPDGSEVVIATPIPQELQVGQSVDVEGDLGYKATLKVRSDGSLSTVVFHEDKFWDPATILDVYWSGPDGDVSSTQGTTTRRWVKTVDSSALPPEFGDGSGYTMSTTVKDAAGNTLDTQTASLVVGESSGPGLERVRVSSTNGGDLKVVTNVDGWNGGSTSLQVVATDDSGAVLVDTIDDMATKTTRLFGMDTLTFEDPSSAADQPYAVVLSAFGDDGVMLGSSDYEVVVEGLLVDTTQPPPSTPFTVAIDGEEVAGRCAIVQVDATNYALVVGIASDSVARVDLDIIDLIGNPSHPESASFEPFDEAKRFVTKGSGGVGTLDGGGSATVEVFLLDDLDQVIGTSSGTVSNLPDNSFKRGGPTSNGGPMYSSSPWVRNWQYGISSP